jgi:hypothetical protein
VRAKHNSIRLTVSPLGGNRYRSRIDATHGDASFGAGEEFAIEAALIDNLINEIDSDKATRSTLEEFGRTLFKAALANTVAQKYYSAADLAKTEHARLRICISVLAPSLFRVPWEYLHDQSGFLLDHGHSIVRVLDELQGTKSAFSPMQKLLCAAARPSGYYDFGPQEHLEQLRSALSSVGGLYVETLFPATVGQFREKLKSGKFDTIYFVGHGEPDEGGRLVCGPTGGAAEFVRAHQLANWLRDTSAARFVFLNSCSTAEVRGTTAFSGIAQKLMLDGDIAAVAAMQMGVPTDTSLAMAKGFFEEIRRNSPEDALQACRDQAKDDFSFGIPVLYSFLDAPARWEANRIRTLLSASEETKFALLLPRFFEGKMEKPGSRTPNPTKEYIYPGETFARTDVEAAWYIMELLHRVSPLSNVELLPHSEAAGLEASHRFIFGSQSNPVSEPLLKMTARFEFNYKPENQPGKWSLKDKKANREILVTAPFLLDSGEFAKVDDFGIVEKIVDDKTGRVYFILAGFGDRATKACGYYFEKHWEELLDKYGDGPFQLVLKVPGNLSFDYVEAIEPEKLQPTY